MSVQQLIMGDDCFFTGCSSGAITLHTCSATVVKIQTIGCEYIVPCNEMTHAEFRKTCQKKKDVQYYSLSHWLLSVLNIGLVPFCCPCIFFNNAFLVLTQTLSVFALTGG